jgi:hypothetical protein
MDRGAVNTVELPMTVQDVEKAEQPGSLDHSPENETSQDIGSENEKSGDGKDATVIFNEPAEETKDEKEKKEKGGGYGYYVVRIWRCHRLERSITIAIRSGESDRN